jgi:hypothetical protein
MYYRKHMVAQVLDDEMYKQYGGKEEYFRNFSLLPTPDNMFGARFLWDPYEWERNIGTVPILSAAACSLTFPLPARQ